MIYFSILLYTLLLRKDKPTTLKVKRFNEWRYTSYDNQQILRQEYLKHQE